MLSDMSFRNTAFKKVFSSALIAATFSVVAAVTVTAVTAPLIAENVVAEEKKKLTKAEKEAQLKYKNGVTRKRKAVGATCARKLEKVQQFMEEEPADFAGAEKELKGALKRGCKEGFEHSEVNRFLGYVLYSQDKYAEAIAAYLAVVNNEEADPQKRTDTRYTVAQLMYVTEDYKRAAEQLELWMAEAAVVDKGGKILLARSYYTLERKDDSLKLVEEVMAEAEEAGQVPKESWLNFQWVLYYENNSYGKAVKVNHVLLTHYPKVKYWKQISAMYGSLEESRKEMLALAFTELQNGLDKEKQYVALAYQYLAADVPYKAASILEKGMKLDIVERNEKNLQLLGSSYSRAREYNKASPVLEAAAKKSEKGNAYSRLAGVYLNLNDNEKALIAARAALKKGGLKREDITWMNRGTAEFNLHCYDDAVKSFGKAAKFDRSKKGASNWKAYAQREGDRRSELIKNGAPLDGCKKV